MDKIFCFGELLLRMSPGMERDWLRGAGMPVFLGGSELNVAAALATWNLPVKYCTALPENHLSQEICNELKQMGIDVSAILFSGNRIGLYYLPQGTDLQNAGVIYDRQYSSFSELKPGMIDWNKVLRDSNWFHFSAINPALNENAVAVCREALEAAAKKNFKISIDLNYRSKLWQYGKRPQDVMPELVSYCNIVMGNPWSANELLAIPFDKDIHQKKSRSAYLEQATNTAQAILKEFPQCELVANTFRFDEGSGIRYFAAIDTKNEQVVSQEFSTDSVVDRAGSGDCFMAGLIYGICREFSLVETVNYAASAAFGKLQEKGDSTKQTTDQIQTRIKQHA